MHKRVAPEQIASAILVLRGQRVLLDTELTALYRVTTRCLNEQGKRNAARLPPDFIFRLTQTETIAQNRSQNATGSQKHRDPRLAPYAFTEHGAIMASTILSSPRVIEMSAYAVRAFVRLRETLASNRELAHRFAQLETRLDKKLTIHDEAIAAILSAFRRLIHPPIPKRRTIGFTADLREKV